MQKFAGKQTRVYVYVAAITIRRRRGGLSDKLGAWAAAAGCCLMLALFRLIPRSMSLNAKGTSHPQRIKHTPTHTHARARARTHITHTHTHTYTHTLTHTHTHTQPTTADFKKKLEVMKGSGGKKKEGKKDGKKKK